MSEQDEKKYPCATLDEALRELRRPPAPQAVKFKLQDAIETSEGGFAQIVSYVDARLVYDRLDHVCGGNWFAVCEELPAGLQPQRPVEPQDKLIHVRCKLTLFGVTREDVGEGQDPKAAVSDAVKRAAVQFGIARAIYAMRSPWLAEGDADSELRRNHRGRLVLDRRTDDWCRGRYEAWLEERGIARFGEPLPHGDDQRVPEQVAAGSGTDGTAEGLRAVSNSWASALAALTELIDRSPYSEETVSGLARLVHQAEGLDRLSEEQLADTGLLVEVAIRGAVEEETLRATIERLAERDDRPSAVAWLRQRLIERANERQLLDRRAA